MCSFMEAELGNNPSYVWRTLLDARELLQAGSVWWVGDGHTIGIQSHKWLPHPPLFHDGVDLSLKVCDFIDPHTKQWDRGKVNSWFLPSSRDEVLQIHLGNLEVRDKLCWNENKSQTFLVRTAYRVALRMNQVLVAEHSMACEDKQVQKRLWKLLIPPKVQNFVWRASSDILPTQANLVRRKVPVNPKCAICGMQDETFIHILWHCPLANNAWALVLGKLQKCDSSAQNFHDLACTLMEKLSKRDIEIWAMVAQSIWNAQNRFQFEATQTPPHAILKGAMSLIEDYQRLACSMPHS